MKNSKIKFILIIASALLSHGSIAQYVHSFSGTKFAKEIGHFKFLSPRLYDDIGKDISVGYRSLSLIELTHYIYPSSEELSPHFNNYKNSLLSRYKGAKVLSTEDIITSGIKGEFSKFEFFDNFHGKDQKIYSYLYMYKHKGWFIMLRITCDTDLNAMIEKEISEYIEIMPFPTIELKN
jgi:hypothetical protein